jgi:hypothetical protein
MKSKTDQDRLMAINLRFKALSYTPFEKIRRLTILTVHLLL